MSEAKLREYLKFNDSDLRANQNGQVSDKQKTRLAQTRKTSATRWIVIFGLLLVIPVAIAIWLLKAVVSDGLSLTNLFNAYGIPILIFGSAALFVVWVVVSVVLKKPDDILRSMEGEVEYVRVERQEKDYARSDSHHDMYKTVQAYELHLGKSTLGDVDKAMMEVVKQGDVYKMYYTRDGGILSAELVKTGK